MLEAKAKNEGHKAQLFSMKKVPKIFSREKKVFAREDAEFPRKIGRSLKKRSLQAFREFSAVFQGKVKRRSWPWPSFNTSKKVLSSSREQFIFEDL